MRFTWAIGRAGIAVLAMRFLPSEGAHEKVVSQPMAKSSGAPIGRTQFRSDANRL
jgi:hypothetical protein